MPIRESIGENAKPFKSLPSSRRRKKEHPIRRKTGHILLSFLLGVVITTVVHIFLSNQRVIRTAEAVCTVFGRDEQECKDGIEDVLNMADGVVQNNANVKGE